MPYLSASKIFLQSKQRFWTSNGLSGFGATDLPIGQVWDVTYKQSGSRGILQAFPLSLHSRRVTQMTEMQRIRYALEQVEMLYPGMSAQFEGGVTKCWDEDRWAHGASSFYKPGQFTSLLPHVARAEGRIHFAGEHVRVDRRMDARGARIRQPLSGRSTFGSLKSAIADMSHLMSASASVPGRESGRTLCHCR